MPVITWSRSRVADCGGQTSASRPAAASSECRRRARAARPIICSCRAGDPYVHLPSPGIGAVLQLEARRERRAAVPDRERDSSVKESGVDRLTGGVRRRPLVAFLVQSVASDWPRRPQRRGCQKRQSDCSAGGGAPRTLGTSAADAAAPGARCIIGGPAITASGGMNSLQQTVRPVAE